MKKSTKKTTEEMIHPYCGRCGHNYFDEKKMTKSEAKKDSIDHLCHWCIEELNPPPGEGFYGN